MQGRHCKWEIGGSPGTIIAGSRAISSRPGPIWLPAPECDAYPPPKVMRRMTSWPSIQRCLKAAATWPAATASMP